MDKNILEVRRTPRLNYSNSYDKEIILEGLEADTLRITQRPMRLDEILVLCMPLQIEISLDSSSKTLVNEKSMKEQKDQGNK